MLSYRKILNKLISNNISISTAESCTGGLLAYSLIKNKDSSKVFEGGYITYSNRLKIKDLKVIEQFLQSKSNWKDNNNNNQPQKYNFC